MTLLSTRWKLVFKDLWRNRSRSLLAIMSIAVGVVAVGSISTSTAVIQRNMDSQYLATRPADIVLWTSSLDEEAIAAVQRLPEVAAAEGKISFRVQVQMGEEDWKPVDLYVVDPDRDAEIGRIALVGGKSLARQRDVVLERQTMDYVAASIGETLTIKAFGDLSTELRVVGVAHNLGLPPPMFNGGGSGYISADTLPWFGMMPLYSQVHVRVTDDLRTREGLEAVAQAVTARIQNGGGEVQGHWLPKPGRHWASDTLDPVMLIMQVLGLLALGLAAFLVINTIMAILAQQRRSVGMLKAIGARQSQIVVVYLAMVLILALMALLLAMPVKMLLARSIADFVANMLNFDISDYRPPVGTVLLEVVAGVAVPLIAALGPVIKGTRITVRQAINDYGLTEAPQGGLSERLLHLRVISQTFVLALRNTFRRRGRLVLTLATLVMGGAVFISVANVQASLGRTTDEALQYWNHELVLTFNEPLRIQKISNELAVVPGIAEVEYWGVAGAERVLADGSHGQPFNIVAPPADTQMIIPTLIEGRWLLPEDQNALVINSDLLKVDPSINVGDAVTLQLDRHGSRIETEWVVVGIAKALMVGPLGYANYPYLAHTVGEAGKAFSARVRLNDASPANQEAMGKLLAAHLDRRGIAVRSWESTASLRQNILGQLNTVVGILLTMAVLFAFVGGLGLMGTLSINVLERRRELGVMRAIGASGRAVRRVVAIEGLFMALISWAIGALVALPLSALLSQVLGVAMIRSPLTQVYSFGGLILWLLVVLGIAALAVVLPAHRASGVSVRQVLAYD